MKRALRSSPRRNAAEWRRLVSLWQRSGETVEVFAERHQLSRRSLAWWRWKLSKAVSREEADESAALAFVPVVATPAPGEARWVVQTAEGIRVEMTGTSALVLDGLGVALSQLPRRD